MPPSPSELTFWLDVASPHMLPLIEASAAHFDHIRVFTTEGLDAQRIALGWNSLPAARLDLRHLGSASEVDAALEALRHRDTAHIFSGLAAYPRVARARQRVASMGQVHGILAEVPDPAGTLGSAAKRLRDAAELRRGKTRPHFLGAIGLDALSYYRAVSSRRTEVFEFGYFPELRSSGRSAGRKGPIRLAAIGSLMAHKGFDLLIEALARLPQNDVTLSIAGSGPDEAKLKALSARLGLSERVVFAGLIPPTEMPGFLEAADLAVMPSRYDGWGAVANEALAVGTPILVSEAYGARSLLVSPILGAVFPAGSAESLLEALSTMVRRMEALRSTRHEIADWARRSITPAAGARYLSAIVRYSAGQQADRPVPCWKET